MNRTLKVLVLSLTLGILFLAQTVWAAALATGPEAALKKAFPEITVDSMQKIDVPGWYEVVTGQNVLYFYPEKDYLFVGEIYGKDRQSLTAARKRQLSAKLVKTLPLEKGVKIGSGKNIIIEFTDPDCPYCRKASEFLSKQRDVTRYVFFAPLAHPAAIGKIHHILNARDKAHAYEEMMRGATPPQGEKFSESVKSLAQEHLALARKVGVQGTPTFFVNGTEVVGADEKRIEALLTAGK